MMPKEAQQAHLASSLLTTKAYNFYNRIQFVFIFNLFKLFDWLPSSSGQAAWTKADALKPMSAQLCATTSEQINNANQYTNEQRQASK
jgi:hypothetical protein